MSVDGLGGSDGCAAQQQQECAHSVQIGQPMVHSGTARTGASWWAFSPQRLRRWTALT